MTVDRSKLPYPGQDVAMAKRGGRLDRVSGPEGTIAMGTAQLPKARRGRTGARLRDSEGVLCFTEEGVVFYGESGRNEGVPYEEIEVYSIKAPFVGGTRKLTLAGESWSLTFKLGGELVANAEYILSEQGISSQ